MNSNTPFTVMDKDAENTTASDRIADTVHRTVDRVASRARGVEQGLRERASVLRDEAREQQERARAMVTANVKSAVTYARENPLIAAGVAVAAGLALFSLLRPRR